MRMTPWMLLLSAVLLMAFTVSCNQPSEYDSSNSIENPPQVQIDQAQISLLSKEPDIVTPTGVQVDDQNRIWVIENHTHVRQDDYPGPDHDKILVFSGYLDSKSEKKITEFATDFKDGMSLSLTRDRKVLITTRVSVLEYSDDDGDLVADDRKTLISMETEEVFPHNGMSGLVISPDNKIYFQCGENFGAYYEISGSDGTILHGKEREGGSIYRCDMDGSNLERIGTAIWNCFAMTFDDFGNLFAVENDPDSRPPCRLLHIVKGGNYGFQFQHGRDGLSPLTSWFGELPGTLPMVAGTKEAPSGVLYYDQDNFGEALTGSLLVTGWGDNEIESFKLKRKGSSFTSQSKSFVKGGRNFYPVGLAMDDRGAVIATDWASVSYAVHGEGRIWRISNPNNDEKNKNISSSAELSKEDLLDLLNSRDPRIRADAADLVVSKHVSELKAYFQSTELSDRGKMNIIWAAQSNAQSDLASLLDLALEEENELLRSASVRMIGDQKIKTNEQFYLNLIKNDPSPFVKREAIYGLFSENSFESVIGLFGNDDPFIQTAIIETFGKSKNLEFLLGYAKSSDAKKRLAALLCLRRSAAEKAKNVIPNFLNDASPDNRLTVLKWIAEDNLKDFRSEAEVSFNSLTDVTSKLFDAYMVTFQYLDGEFNQKNHFMEGDEHVRLSFYKRQKFLLATAQNSDLNYQIRTRALSAIDPNYDGLDAEILKQFAKANNTTFQVEAIRSLSARPEDNTATKVLQNIAGDSKRNENVRLEAIVALSNSAATNKDTRAILLDILKNENEIQSIKQEAMRSIDQLSQDQDVAPWIAAYKKALPEEDEASSVEYWRELGNENGSSVAGARIFHSNRYQCNSCHRIDGRGGIFGPDLSKVGSNTDRQRIVESILNPNDIVTPVYAGYAVTTDKDVTVGRLDKDLDSKRHLQMILATGERKAIAYDDIEEQSIMEASLMPANLHRRMTAHEFRDLIQYLSDRK